MMTYKYKLYRTRNTEYLDKMLCEASYVWNRALALYRRYYRLTGKYISCSEMKAHFAKRSKRVLLNSQTVQEVLERLNMSYMGFFHHKNKRPPKFKKASEFSSFVYKQYGYKLCENEFVINSIGKRFRFSYSRPYKGVVKQVRIKRNRLGEYYIYIITDATANICHRKTLKGASVGMDFGLKTFLTLSDGTIIKNPEFFKNGIHDIKRASKKLSKSIKGSHHHEKARRDLARLYKRIYNQREDWQWKTAHVLCNTFSKLFIEDLNLKEMMGLWGRKVGDIAFGDFVRKLQYVASKYGVVVYKVDRFYASSKTCGTCGYVNKELTLKERLWVCPICGTKHDRDLNASMNILRQGIVSLGSNDKTL